MIRLLIILLTSVAINSFCQNGYVKLLKNDSVITGYLRHYKSFEYGEPGIEVWKTKMDKNPRRVLKSSISEYAIKKDTFRVLQNFRPFENSSLYFDLTECEVVLRGKRNLFKVGVPNNPSSINPQTGAPSFSINKPLIKDEPFITYNYIFIMEDQSSGYIRALSKKKDKLILQLLDFFPERYIQQYGEKRGEISYKSLVDFTKLYNSK